MRKICYGRFNLPHLGHRKVMANADAILVAQSKDCPVPFEAKKKVISEYLNDSAEIIQVTNIFTYLGSSPDEPVELWLGEDRKSMGEQLSKYFNVTVHYLKRDGASSTRVREVLRSGDYKALLDEPNLVASISHASELETLYRHEQRRKNRRTRDSRRRTSK